jgi:hypothetical protein
LGATVRPRRRRSSSSSRQDCELSRTPSLRPTNSFLPSGVAPVGARKRFFEDLRAITIYLVFSTWAELIDTLRTGRQPVIPDG